MSEWQPIESAPKDGSQIIVYGVWQPFDIHAGGEGYFGMARWSTIMSDGTGHQWFYDSWMGQHSDKGINVEFTHWMPLPPPPEPQGERK